MHRNFLLAVVSLLMGVTVGFPAAGSAREPSDDDENCTVTTMGSVMKEDAVAPTHTAPSSCATYRPSILRQLSEAQPDRVQDDTADSAQDFRVSQSVSSADNVKFDRIQQYVVFESISAGSWDCQLMVSWPQFATISASSPAGTTGSSSITLDVYSATYNAAEYSEKNKQENHKGGKVAAPDSGPFATWRTMMDALKPKGNNGLPGGVHDGDAKLTYFGTVAVVPGEYGVTINSKACPATAAGDALGFIFEITGTDSRNASLEFQAKKWKGSGVYLLANC